MKSKLVWEEEVVEIDLGDGDYVMARPRMAVKDVAAVSAGQTQAQVSRAMLIAMIISWRGPSFVRNGEEVPVNEANIDRLDMEVATELVAKITEAGDKEMDDEEKKDSTESL